LEKQVLDKRMEHLDSGIRRNDEIRDFNPQIFLKCLVSVALVR